MIEEKEWLFLNMLFKTFRNPTLPVKSLFARRLVNKKEFMIL